MSYEIMFSTEIDGSLNIVKWKGDKNDLIHDIEILGGEAIIMGDKNELNPKISVKCNQNVENFSSLLKALQMNDPAHFSRLNQDIYDELNDK